MTRKLLKWAGGKKESCLPVGPERMAWVMLREVSLIASGITKVVVFFLQEEIGLSYNDHWRRDLPPKDPDKHTTLLIPALLGST